MHVDWLANSVWKISLTRKDINREALKKVVRFEEQLAGEGFDIEKQQLLRRRPYDYEKIQKKFFKKNKQTNKQNKPGIA